jgi:FMN hydrolase / 5-amino-6-(5-phospho-D-ribitylamino)uracil phosphatase
MQPRVILWDVMDTLVHDPFRDAMPAFFGMSLEELLRVKHPSAWGRFEKNELSEAAFLASFFADGRAYDREGFKACIRAAYRWIDGIEPLLARLSRRPLEMHTLSNYPEWYRWIEERLSLSRYVRWSFVSCLTAVRKPDPLAYLGALRALGREPGQCLFIDDRARNCEAAAAAGLHALHFTGDVTALEAELARLGLL